MTELRSLSLILPLQDTARVVGCAYSLSALTGCLFLCQKCCNFLPVVEKISPPYAPFLNLQNHCSTDRIRS
jgi:hypothetical protein